MSQSIDKNSHSHIVGCTAHVISADTEVVVSSVSVLDLHDIHCIVYCMSEL